MDGCITAPSIGKFLDFAGIWAFGSKLWRFDSCWNWWFHMIPGRSHNNQVKNCRPVASNTEPYEFLMAKWLPRAVNFTALKLQTLNSTASLVSKNWKIHELPSGLEANRNLTDQPKNPQNNDSSEETLREHPPSLVVHLFFFDGFLCYEVPVLFVGEFIIICAIGSKLPLLAYNRGWSSTQ